MKKIECIFVIFISLLLIFILNNNFFEQIWFPHDIGLLGHMSERVFNGEKPHIDFNDTYTGLLSYIHSAFYKYYGVSLAGMFIPLKVLVFAIYLLVFFICTNFFSLILSSTIAFFVIITSALHFFQPMPSWYNLLFCLTSLSFLILFNQTKNQLYICLSAASLALSFLIKVSGLFSVISFFLALGLICNIPIQVFLFLSIFLTSLLLLKVLNLTIFNTFILPQIAFLIFALKKFNKDYTKESLSLFLKSTIFFLITYISLIAIYYSYIYSISDLKSVFEGLFVTPSKRLSGAIAFQYKNIVFATQLIIIFSICFFKSKFSLTVKYFIAFLIYLIYFSKGLEYIFIQQAPLIASFYALVFITNNHNQFSKHEINFIFILIYIIYFSFIQFPFTTNIYSLYIFPLSIICFSFIFFNLKNKMFFPYLYLLLIISYMYTNLRINFLAHVSQSKATTSSVNPRIPKFLYIKDKEVYYEVNKAINEHSKNKIIYAGPDSPEIYFFYGKKSITPIMYEFFNGKDVWHSIIDKIIKNDIQFSIIKRKTLFSNLPPKWFIEKLNDYYSNKKNLKEHVVFWN